jgi:hypothetical protein
VVAVRMDNGQDEFQRMMNGDMSDDPNIGHWVPKIDCENMLKELADDGYHICIFKHEKSYRAEVQKQHDEDKFEEWETPGYASIDEVITIVYRHVLDRWWR